MNPTNSINSMNPTNPILVSVIVTTKNEEKNIANCLKSIINSTNPINSINPTNSINPINPTNLRPGVNRETLRKDLNDLIVKKIILRKGQKKGIYYEFA